MILALVAITVGLSACDPVNDPRGTLDTLISPAPNQILAAGWVVDPNAPTSPVWVDLVVDSSVIASQLAEIARPDVARALNNVGPNHGFNFVGTVPAGSQRACLVARNLGAGSPSRSIGCRDVVVGNANPVGVLQSAAGTAVRINVTGWAADPDTTDPINVRILVDQVPATTVRADLPNPASTIAGSHGFSVTVDASFSQAHLICAEAINVGQGSANSPIGCIIAISPS